MQNELLEYLGLDAEKVKTIEDFKAAFDPTFIRKSVDAIRKDEIYGELVGKLTGSITTKTKSYFKEHGIELDSEEIKGKPVEEIFNIGLGKLKGSLSQKITELEGKVGSSSDENTKALQIELDKIKTERDDWKGKWTGLGTEFESYKTNIVTENKNKTLKELKQKGFDSIKYKADLDPLHKKGFITDIEENFKIDLDESGTKLVITKDGKPVTNPKVAGKVYEFEELLQEKAIEAKLYSINPHGGKTILQPQQPINQPVIKQRAINTRAL